LKRLFQKGILLFLCLLLSLCFLELFSRFYLESWFTKQLESSKKKFPIDLQERIWSGKKDKSWGGSLGMVPHPYFGFIIRREQAQQDEERDVIVGGFERADILFSQRNKKELIIGILGASVADMLAHFEFKYSKIRGALKLKYPELRQVDIKILNLAVPAFKQPQQMNVLAIYGKSVDMIISLDGSNDTTYSISSSFPFYYPMESMSYLYFSKNQLPQAYIKVVFSLKLRRIATDYLDSKLSLVKTMALLFIKQTTAIIFETEKDIVDKSKTSEDYFYNSAIRTTFQEKADFYLRMLKYQASILEQEKIPGFFFLQPVAYLGGSKTLTNEEKLFFSLTKSKFFLNKEPISGIEHVRESVRKKELDLIDLTQIFKNESETVYTDECCHLNEKGYQILTNEIIKVLFKSPEKMHLFLQRIE
jgi:hypothetical protein